MLTTINRLFPLWALIFSALAYAFPEGFVQCKTAIVPLLAFIMFCMGLTLSSADFKRVLAQPKTIALGVLLQFLLMPLLAFLIAKFLQLPPQLAAGLILVGCCSGGTASNVICYLAKANVALSITLTLISTLLGLVLTPLLANFYIDAAITVDMISMFLSILKMVIAPVIAGVILHQFLPNMVSRCEPVLPTLSIAAIVFIIAIVVALNQTRLSDLSILVLAAVMLHNMLGLGIAYGLSRLLRLNESDCRTIAIEVGMQNSGLAVALAMKYLTAAAALPAALFSIWHNIMGSLLASFWQQDSSRSANQREDIAPSE
ncbi:MAG: bile acid:sodium symporter family protein [Pseudomonadales bacterium]|nr:bile acid:sodium symporter family protein [Pseudomonadales bacterium]